MSINMDMLLKLAVMISLSGLLISGCSDESATTAEAKKSSETESLVKPISPEPPTLKDRGVTVLSEPQVLAEAGDYHKVTSGADLLYFFGANTPEKLDLSEEVKKMYAYNSDLGDPMLASLVKKYRNGDQFEQRDTSKQIEAVLSSKISSFSNTKYIMIDVPGALDLGKYDFEQKGFKIENGYADSSDADPLIPYERRSVSFEDVLHYKLSFVNASDVNFLPMANEEDARKLMNDLKGKATKIRVYGFVHSVAQDPADSYKQRYVVMKIQKLEIASFYDEDREVFATAEF